MTASHQLVVLFVCMVLLLSLGPVSTAEDEVYEDCKILCLVEKNPLDYCLKICNKNYGLEDTLDI